MPDDQRILGYESTPRGPRLRQWPIMWALICLNLWGMALIGPVFVVMGLASFAWPSVGSHLFMFGKPLRTGDDRVIWMLLNLGISAVGFAFARWHLKHWGERDRR